GLGVAVAYLYSLAATLVPGLFPESFHDASGGVATYFEAAAVIVALVLLGQVMELNARSQTSAAIQALLRMAPTTARRITPANPGGSTPPRQHRRGYPSRSCPGRGPPARATGREGAGGRRGPRGSECGRRILRERRADPGGEGAGEPAGRGDDQRHGLAGHAR